MEQENIASGRSQRIRKTSSNRLSALEKLKQLKASGLKYKAEIKDIDNVYEEVDEYQYSEIVKSRQDDDWIVDDGLGSYRDDGREIFEMEDENAEDNYQSKKRPKLDAVEKNKYGADIKQMFLASSLNKNSAKEPKSINLQEDDVLNDIVKELNSTITSKTKQNYSKSKKFYSPHKSPYKSLNFHRNKEHERTEMNQDYQHENKFYKSIENSPPSCKSLMQKGDDNYSRYLPNEEFEGNIVKNSSTHEYHIKPEFYPKNKSSHQKIVVEEENNQADDLYPSGCIDDFSNDSWSFHKNLESVSKENSDKTKNNLKDPKSTKTEPFQTDFTTKSGIKKELETDICSTNNKGREGSPPINTRENGGMYENFSFQIHKDSETGKPYFLMYWIDAYEDLYNKPGTIYLFGKTYAPEIKAFVSCGVIVRNVPRTVYLLPKNDQVEILDVYNEFNEKLAEKHKIKKFLSRKVTKRYAFDKFSHANEVDDENEANQTININIPLVSAYLEVRYDASLPVLPNDWREGTTFNRILGTKTPFLETFLLEKKIMGPCWLKIGLDPTHRSSSSSLTWCKLETCLENGTDSITLYESGTEVSENFNLYQIPPPLTSLTLSFQTIMTEKTKERELIMVAGIVERGLSIETGAQDKTSKNLKTPTGKSPKISNADEDMECFCVITRPSDAILPSDFRRHLNEAIFKNRNNSTALAFGKCPTKMEIMPSQRALVSYLLAKLHKIDPDIIVGFDMANYDLGLLLKICQSSKIANWSRIGRLKRSIFPKLNSNRGHGGDSGSSYLYKQVMSGRLLCDVLPNCRELIKCTSYTLSEICQVVLGDGQFLSASSYAQQLGSKAANSEGKSLVEPNGTSLSHYLYVDSPSLVSAVRATVAQVTLLHRISDQLKVVPLAYQLTRISGNILSRTLTGGRAERNTFLLLHAFHDQNYLSPEISNPVQNNGRSNDKSSKINSTQKSKPKLSSKAKNVSFQDDSFDPSLNEDNFRDLSAVAGDTTFFDEEFDMNDEMAAVSGHSFVRGKKKKSGPAYIGGLVFEPKVGFYDKYVLLLDFNSLYPSIIQEFNVCFTTIPSDDGQSALVIDPELRKDLNEGAAQNGVGGAQQQQHLGILPIEIRKLVESRRHIKSLMKDPKLSPSQRAQYEIRQKALKLTANSMYGCLGFPASRFYAKPLASFITQKGRDILINTKEIVTKMSLDVVYGDTDSLMVNTYSQDLAHVFRVGNKVKLEVNKLYKYLELELDGVFKSLLLIKKKKYAALKVNLPCEDVNKITFEKEVKGLDIVRRDWSALAKNAGSYVLDQILSDSNREIIVDNIHSYLNDIAEAIRNDKVALPEFYIHKQLNKNPEDYPDKNTLPHVQVALRMSKTMGKRYKAGDIISYIICQDLDKPTSKSATQRAYHPDEYTLAADKPKTEAAPDGTSVEADQERLVLDKEYYLAQQILPVIGRLCECIEGTDQAILSQFLGLKGASDTSKNYNGNSASYLNRRDDEISILFGLDGYCDEERFKNVIKLEIPCPGNSQLACKMEDGITNLNGMEGKHTIDLHSVIVKNNTEVDANLSKCSLSPCALCGTELINYVPYFTNTLTLQIKQHIDRYYQNWLRCDDITCAYTTRVVPLRVAGNSKNDIPCPRCNQGNLYPEYDETRLYDQLCYYEYIFDMERAFRNYNSIDQIKLRRAFQPYIPCYKNLKDTVTRYLKNSSYAMIDLGKLFGFYAKHTEK